MKTKQILINALNMEGKPVKQITATFKYYRAGKYSNCWELDRKFYKQLLGLGFGGYEIVEERI